MNRKEQRKKERAIRNNLNDPWNNPTDKFLEWMLSIKGVLLLYVLVLFVLWSLSN